MHLFKSTTYYCCFSCSFPNNWTKVIIYPKSRPCFGRLGYTLLKIIIVVIILTLSLLQCSFMQPLWKKNVSTIHMLFLCSFTHMNNLRHNISIRLIVWLFVLCIACVCVVVPTCHGTSKKQHQLRYPSVALPFRPGIFRSVAQFAFWIIKYHEVSFAPEHASRLSRGECSGGSLLWGKICLCRVQTSNDTCVGIESQLRWVQGKALCLFSLVSFILLSSVLDRRMENLGQLVVSSLINILATGAGDS